MLITIEIPRNAENKRQGPLSNGMKPVERLGRTKTRIEDESGFSDRRPESYPRRPTRKEIIKALIKPRSKASVTQGPSRHRVYSWINSEFMSLICLKMSANRNPPAEYENLQSQGPQPLHLNDPSLPLAVFTVS
ncbi:hypothetical protein L596_002115 [Steinernema carpocapsae]|uniref:Uncharacterized protein n=1 Tax=Steinernema carpocapsae TaxID=34508 RepID=A0A4U8UNL8_STECR|nr:hypothetical protein L596_002115 [Steinernema carpocapsae]